MLLECEMYTLRGDVSLPCHCCSNLPPKNKKEEKKHRKEVEKMLKKVEKAGEVWVSLFILLARSCVAVVMTGVCELIACRRTSTVYCVRL